MSDGGARPEHKESCTHCSFHVPEHSGNLSSSHQFNHNPTVLHGDVVGRVDVVPTAMFCFALFIQFVCGGTFTAKRRSEPIC